MEGDVSTIELVLRWLFGMAIVYGAYLGYKKLRARSTAKSGSGSGAGGKGRKTRPK